MGSFEVHLLRTTAERTQFGIFIINFMGAAAIAVFRSQLLKFGQMVLFFVEKKDQATGNLAN